VGYELVMDLLIFAGLVWLARGIVRLPSGRWAFNWQPRYPRDGMLFWIYLCVYSLGRFFIQFYRQDTTFALGLSQAQLLSVMTAMVAVWMLVFQIQRARKRGASERSFHDALAPDDESGEQEVPEHAPLTH
jgi:prolipoprotein diacylglyceryltransferase